MPNHPVPKTQIETLKDIIEGYYEAADTGELVEDEDVEDETEYSDDVIGRQKKFLADVGVLERDGYDYTLLEPGHQIGRALAFDRGSDAVEAFRELLNGWEVTDQLKDDLGNKSHAKDKVIESLAYLTETDHSSPRKKTGLSALVDLYRWTGILSETGDGEYQVSATEIQDGKQETELPENETGTHEPEEEEEQTERSSSDPPHEPAQTSSTDSFAQEVTVADDTVSVDIKLSGDENPQNVRELIVAVRKGLQENIKISKDTNEQDSARRQTLNSSDTNE